MNLIRISLFAMLLISADAVQSHNDTCQSHYTNDRKYSIADTAACFIYDHSFLTFLGFLCCSNSFWKAVVANLVTTALAHEHLRLNHIAHGKPECWHCHGGDKMKQGAESEYVYKENKNTLPTTVITFTAN